MAKNPRAKSARDLRRRIGNRKRYDRVLIVCEGEMTECNYFDEIRQKLRISTAHVHVLPSERGTDPKNVVKSAEEVFNRKGKSFERVYAVFDRDDHPEYANAIFMARSKNEKLKNDEKQRVTFEAIVSVPCFELWLLLHFSEVNSSIHRDRLFQLLKTYIPDYTKGMLNLFDLTASSLELAKQRAAALKQKFQQISDGDPYTDVHELVEFLQSLKISA